MSVDMDTA